MEEQKIAELDDKDKNKGIVYITDNDNMFIAAENISQEELNRLSLETDIQAAREKLSKMEEELKNMNKGEHSEEIERNTPLTSQNPTPSVSENEKPLIFRKKNGFKNILVLDTETTGLFPHKGDEILQFSAVDGNGNELLNSYVRPEHRKKWTEAQKKNGITYETVKDAPRFSELKDKIQSLIDNADLIVSYNGKFDMDFLQTYGIKVDPEIPHIDINKKFREIPRELPMDGSKLRYQLIDAAKHFGISFNPHNSLEDAQTTLKVAKILYGQNLENLTEEEIKKNSPSKMPPKKKESQEFKASIFKAGFMALQNQELLAEIRKNPKLTRLNEKISNYMEKPADKKALNSLKWDLGRYVMENDPSMVEKFSKHQKENKVASQINEQLQNSPEGMNTVLPPFSVMTKNGMRQFENMKIVKYDTEAGQYLLDNGKEKIKLPVATFQTIIYPELLNPKKNEFDQAETIEEGPAVVAGVTKIPEFAMITAGGMQTYKDLVVQKYNEAENSYTLTNGNTTLTVAGDTFKEITLPERFEKQFDEKTPEYEKLIKSQYEDYFQQRDNTANNFRHNLAVYVRKEANSPLDALTIAKDLVSRMDRDEKLKTQQLLKQMAREDETINQLIVRTYYEAIKEVPLNQERILNNENIIAKPFYDTLNDKGQLVDKDSTLRIGDTIKDLAFNVPKAFGIGKDKIYEDLTVVSSSKEGNKIVLMDKNRSFYEVPRDTLLEGYNKQQEKQHKAEMKQHKANRIDVGWER